MNKYTANQAKACKATEPVKENKRQYWASESTGVEA